MADIIQVTPRPFVAQAVQYSGLQVSSPHRPEPPTELRELAGRNIAMQPIDQQSGRPLWAPCLLVNGRWMRVPEQAWVILMPNGRLVVVANETFNTDFDRVDPDLGTQTGTQN